MKKHLVYGIVGGLLLTNGILGYQFEATYSQQEMKIHKQSDQIERLSDINTKRNIVIKEQQKEIDTYEKEVKTLKGENNKLNNQIKDKDDSIKKLKKQLEETKEKVKNLP